MLLLSLFLSVAVFSTIAAPQLKIGNSGYEIISINDKNPDDLVPLASKLTSESASRLNGIGSLSLEKVTDSIDDDEDGLSFTLQQHKRHYDPQSLLTSPKTVIDSQSNIIDVTSKQSSSDKSNIYLTVGIPRSFSNPTSSAGSQNSIPITDKADRNSQSKDSFDDSDSREDSRSQEKLSTKTIVPNKTNDEKLKSLKSSKQPKTPEKFGIDDNDSVSSAMFQADFEVADLKDEEKISALVSEANRALNLIDTKTDFQAKTDRIESPTVKSGFTMVTHFPSIQIHHQKTSFVPLKEPAMFSSIYPAGFDIPIGNKHLKPVIPKNFYEKHLRGDNKKGKGKKNAEPRLDDRNRVFVGHELEELRRGTKKINKLYEDKNSHKFSSVFLLDAGNHDLFNERATNLIPIPINLPFLNQQSSRVSKHKLNNALEMKSIPFVSSNHFKYPVLMAGSPIFQPQGRWERFVSRDSTNLAKRHQQLNDFDREYPDHQISGKSETKADFLKNYMGQMNQLNVESSQRQLEPSSELLPPIGETSKDLIIGILQEIDPDDLPETIVDIKKNNTHKENHEIHDTSSSKSNSKKIKLPGFYEFLAKFSNILLGKTLQYEADIQAGQTLSKLMEITKKQNSNDNEILRSLQEK